MLRLEDLSVHFGQTRALDGVSLSLRPGEVLGVVGPSGCGKSTLLRAVAGLETLASGRVLLDEQDVTRLPTHRRGFALMFQDGQLFPQQTVAGNVGYPLRLRRAPGEKTRVEELLSLVGLDGFGPRATGSLSGGERQRVALARALAVRPRLLLLDEPLSALDRSLRERLAEDLRAILTAEGTTALLVTHDHEEAFAIASRVAVMRAGRVVQAGPVGPVWAAPVDEWTARFLGYTSVVDGLALRPGAVVVTPGGPLHGTVQRVRTPVPDAVRLVVLVEGLGVVEAVAPPGSEIGENQAVRLSLDRTRVAELSREPTTPDG